MPLTLNRRTLMIASFAAAAVATAGCSSNTPGTAPSTAGEGLIWPTQVPLEKLPGAHISDVPGVAPAYEQWPNPSRQSVKTPPGSGGNLRTLAPTWSTAPPPIAKNKWAQEVQKDLNVKWSPEITADYGQVIPTTLASGKLPDLMFLEWTSNPSVLQAMQQGAFADLTPHLTGDKIKDYPNLANFPEYAWKASALLNKLWIVPNTLSKVNQFDVWRMDWVESLGHSGPAETTDQFLEICKDVTEKKPGGRDCYAFTTLDRGTFLAREMHAVPNEWSEKDGKFSFMFEEESYAKALEWAAKCWKEGLFHPDALSMDWAKSRDLWAAGKTFIEFASLDLFFGNGETGMRGSLFKADPQAKGEHFIPPGATDAGPNLLGSSVGFWGGAGISAEHEKDEKKMKELLSILDYWVAPFGTQEFLLMRHGIEGRHFTFNKDGQPEPTNDAGAQEELNMNVLAAPVFLYYPAKPQTAVEAQAIVEANLAHIQPNAAWGLVSDTWMRKSAALGNIVSDTVRKIVTGEEKVTSLDAAVQSWRSAGGDAARKEFEEAFAEKK